MKKEKKIKVVLKKLGRERALGQAWMHENLVELEPRQKPKKFLAVLIHEILHCLEPDWSESKVDRHSMKIADIVWKQGYRKIFLDNEKIGK